jgi:hypothetical protein
MIVASSPYARAALRSTLRIKVVSIEEAAALAVKAETWR